MGRRRSSHSAPAAALTLLPFLDIVFATLGVFIIVFVLQKLVQHEAGRQASIDSLIVCTSAGELVFYLTPHTPPRAFALAQLPLVFEALTSAGPGIRNLVFALNSTCVGMRQPFADAFTRFTALSRREGTHPAAAFRLTFRPLSAHPEAVEQLLHTWRGGQHD
jgi:hypothetical protein